ncbi:MAG: cellulase family glycosylhydrolase, partial [Chloroflexota bacterium]
IWQQIATRYQDAPDSVYFELLNEPNSILGASKWNRLLADALAIVRESNPVRIVIIGPVHWNQIAQLTSLELPPEDRRIIVTFHYYHPFQFTHQGASWVDGAYDWGGTTWTGTDLEKREIELDMKLALDWATKENRPLYMGEFGAYSVADMESRVRWTQFVRSQAEAHNISWAYWEFASGFGAYDPARDEWREPLLKALIP